MGNWASDLYNQVDEWIRPKPGGKSATSDILDEHPILKRIGMPPTTVHAGGDPRRVAALDAEAQAQEAIAAANAPQYNGGGGAGGGGRHPVLEYIQSKSPGMSQHEARKLLTQFRQEKANPGLADFISSQSPNADRNGMGMQMFFNKTVAPYLKQTADQYNVGAAAGTAAMQNILAGAAPSPAIDVLKQWLPVQQAGNQQMGAALQGAAVSGPYYDEMMRQLQENIKEQQQTQFYDQQLTAQARATPTTSGTDPAIAKLFGL